MSCSKDELELRELREWLTKEVHLDRYFDKLTEHGFCSLRLIKDLSEEDLDDLNIRPPYHRKRLLKFCSELGEQDNVAATSATESVETGSEKAIASPAESAPEIDNKPCADDTQDENLETSSSLVNECRDSDFVPPPLPPPLPPKEKQKKGNGEVARERPSVPDRESSLKREQNQIESTNTDAGITSDSGTKLQQPSVLSEVDNVVSVEPGLPQLPSSNKKKLAPPLPKHVVSPVKRTNKVKAPPPIPPRSDLEVNSQDVPKVASESIESKESDSNVIVNDQFEEVVSEVSNVETSRTSTPSPPQGEVVENETRSVSPKSSRPLARSRPAKPPRKHIEKRRESGNSETEEIETSEGISSENDGVAERVTTGVIGDSASVKEEAVFPRNGKEKPEETEEEGPIYGNVSTTSKPLAPPEEKEEECSIYGNISTTSTPVAPPPTPPTRGGSTKRPLPTPRPPVTLRNKSVPGPNQKQPAQPYRHSMVSERFAGNPFLSNLEKQLDAASDIKKSRSLDRPANFAQGVHDITNSSESSSKEECRVEEPPSKAPLARLESASDLMLPKRGDGNLKTTNTADGNNYAEAHHSYERLIEKPIASKADLVTDSTYDLMGGTGVTNPVPVDDNYSQVYDQVDIQNSTSEAGLGGKSRESQAINNEMLKKISAMAGGRAGEELFDYESDESADDLVDEVPERKPRGDSTDSLGTSPAQAAAGPRNLRSTSGYLYKQGGRQNNKGWKKRWFVFDGTSLKYYTNKDSQESLHIIPVTQMKDVLVEPGETRKARFNLITGNRVFMLASDTMTDMNLWAQTLMAAILQYKADDSVKKPGGTMSDPDKEGWLKKQGHNMMGDWKRRYVAIKGGSICYYDTYDDFQFETPIHSIEAQLASVKQDPNHRNRFNIITSQKTFSFQVENDFEVSSWIEAVQRAIQIGLSDPAVLEYVFTNPSNRKCADCGNKDPYPHASVNHFVCICGNCCGSHRSLGSNISKPRSLLMDKKIWNDDLKELMVKIGNENANKLLEFKIPDDDRIRPDADSAKRREFICAKYEYKKYGKILPEYGNVDALGQALRESVQTDDVMRTFELIINRVNVKYVPTDSEDQRTPLELAVAAGKNLQAELLRQNGADSESDDTFTPIVDITEPPSYEVVSSPPVDTFERSGYLYRKEGAMKKRWFTFKDRQLKYFRGCGDKEPMGVIDLANVTSLTMNTNEGTLLLEIVTFDKTHILKGETDEELEAWFTALRNKQVFKVHISLQELGSDGIPHIVANCLQFIETYGLQAEGIYRVPGSQAKMRALALAFNQAPSHVMLTLDDYSVNEVTGTLKKYLRELPEPVIPSNLYQRFIDVSRILDHETKLISMKSVIQQLPKVNYDTLKRIIGHFTKVVAEQQVNLMGIENISVIFGPTLMSNDNTGRMDDSPINQEYKTIGDMITFYQWLFDVGEKELIKDQLMENAMRKITQLREGATAGQPQEFTLDVYVEQKSDNPCLLKVSNAMSAMELCENVVANKGLALETDWALFEVIGKGNLERAFQVHEKVLPAVIRWGELGELSKDNYLIIKPNHIAESIQPFVGTSLTREGMLHVRDPEKRKDWKPLNVILKNGYMAVDKSKSFFKSIKSDKSDTDQWSLTNLLVYLGVPAEKQTKGVDTSCGFTVVVKAEGSGNIIRFLCAKDKDDMYRWVAAILSMKHPTGIWNDPTAREPRATVRKAQESQIYLGRQSRFLRREGSTKHILEEIRQKQKSLRRSTELPE
ncbi:arf-GAP with Rho-GAP domain, ANK repeat and PH domain-containing protein 1 isoform X2 [Nematostella vectensis]|uniref:arf-GAP with Rho-GAP domain, ANK repeat and PH domain-containing protein 1 isoform X2 n=1 Tax=Nematostella vectensis TaxID=45351 RepID=UPI002076EC59|nr:arf-GAP with Rho-GAP domain, ANK repeat and PH domain-containing protein 1 isoform X2 [Nematostella vectensis]